MSVVSDIADIFSRLGIIHNRTTGHIDIDVLAVGAVTLVATTVSTMLCKDVAFVFQVQQRPVVVVATKDDAATLAAIATIGTAIGVVLHMTQVHAAFTALTRAAHNLDVIYEVTFHLQIVDYLLDVSKNAFQRTMSIDMVVQSFLLIPLNERLRL